MSERAAKKLPEANAELLSRIEEVGTRLLVLHGYNGVSYLDIARELNISHSTIHYYFRTKSILAESLLRRVAESTLEAMKSIWTSPENSLFDSFVGTRDWTYGQYLLFNPGGKGGRTWGLLSRFTLEAESLNSTMRAVIRNCFNKLQDYIDSGVQAAIKKGELKGDAPQKDIALQIMAVIAVTEFMTRQSSGFTRLDDLLRTTCASLQRAYGVNTSPRPWPPLPRGRSAGA